MTTVPELNDEKRENILRIRSRGKLVGKKQRSFTEYLFTMGVLWTVIYSLEIDTEKTEKLLILCENYLQVFRVERNIFSSQIAQSFTIPKIRFHRNHFGWVICHLLYKCS